ncbi:MAG: M81 family metallopeptidase, partial [Planctomycetaceae bacterium]
MPNILFAELRQETASFNPFPTKFEMFRQVHGAEILNNYEGTKTEISGFMDVLAERKEIKLVPTVSAASVSGGLIPKDDLNQLLDVIIESIKAAVDANAIDAVYLCLHGAMAG